jgi:2-polyprenyl-6-methoxyphenol hydroxylase-like FAD-dependent oxidoreductase
MHDFFSYYDPSGEPIATPQIPPRPPTELPQGIVIHRVPLAKILREAAVDVGATVQVGITVDTLTQSGDAVTAALTDGSVRSYDLVIGADGVRSKTRGLLFGDQVVPRYSGTTMFRWVVPGVEDVGPMGFYQADSYLNVVSRLRDGSIYLATGRHYGEPPGFLQPDQARHIMRENLAPFTAPLMAELRKHLTDDATIIVNDYNWLLAPDPWYRGRIVLIGDAAHATTATLASGGGMAIEDAVVLGQEVAAGGPVNDVLARFMKRRFDRARLVVETSVELERMLHQGDPIPPQNELRAKAMGVLASPY